MKVRLSTWKIKTLNSKKLKINPQPQYQRTSVWSLAKKRLFIDSILRGYDVPKFYLRSNSLDPHYDFEVTDGQQRMRAIWEFMSDVKNEIYSLGEAIIKGKNTKGIYYQNLEELSKKFEDYELNIAIIEDSTPEEIRSLFARLQMGEQLNKVELRHALASNIGAAIIGVVETHKFFKTSKISNNRYKHQDYLDHAITIAYNNGMSDVKAKNIEEMYKDLADSTSEIFQEYIQKSNEILNWMNSVNNLSKGIFKNKWAFIDMFWLLYKNHDVIIGINNKTLLKRFNNFEQKRLKYNREPEKLIEDPTSSIFDKEMYEYILAFKFSGNTKENIKIRHNIFKSQFLNKGITIK